MLEYVEARVMAQQVNKAISGKIIRDVTANLSPHKFAFYHGDPQDYKKILIGKRIGKAEAVGGM
ncbi:MAG: endonuclease VIII, partial [Mobilitalea sp.]